MSHVRRALRILPTRRLAAGVFGGATLASLAALTPGVALAQEPNPAGCDDDRGWGRRAVACDVRELTFPATGSLSIVDRTNGDISVRAWDGGEVHVRAVVRANARDLEAAREMVANVVISEGDTLRASGPEGRGNQWWGGGQWWTVDYDVQVPPSTNLTVAAINGEVAIRDLSGNVSVEAVNGEIAISDVSGDVFAKAVNGEIEISRVSGDLSAETVNGSVELEGVSGSVKGTAVNGSIEVSLAGERLAEEGVALKTVNGSVDLRMPRGVAAQLELETVTGGMDVDFPITISGKLDSRRISTTLGGGGPPVRVETTGGAISIDAY
jgi:putative adhesin